MFNRPYVVSILVSFGLLLSPLSTWAADASTTECLRASEDSYQLDKEHKFLAERAQLLICTAEHCPADVRKDCTQRLQDVTRSIPSIVFLAKDRAGKDISDVKVTMDGTSIATRLDGTAIMLDPGKHRFTFEMPGRVAVEAQYVILVADKERREVVVMDPSQQNALELPGIGQSQQSAPTESHSSLGKQRVAAIIVGGVGAAGVVVGSVFGLISKSKHNDAEQYCNGSSCSDPRGVELKASAMHAGNASTVAFIVGAAGLAGGATLWFTSSPKKETPATKVGLVPGGILLEGTW